MRAPVALLVTAAWVIVRADRYHPADRVGRAAAADPAETSAHYWVNQAQDAIKAHVQRTEPKNKARNLVMFLGDGMSIPTLAAARTLFGQRNNASGEEAQLFFETFPSTGLVKTYCVNSQIADSACTATSYLCGVKTNQGILGVRASVPRGDCPGARDEANQVQSIAEWALADGRDAGIVTTTRVTHASPSGAYAKCPERNWETDTDVEEDGVSSLTCPDIAQQLIHMHPGNNFKVILGGGRRSFLPKTFIDEEGGAGRRSDGRNLIQEWQKDKINRNVTHSYIWNRADLIKLNDNLPEYVLGLFETNHMMFNLETNPTTEPTLAELTETAIKMLSRNKKGFFLFVEGGRIDHAHHENQVQLALDETIEMDKAVATAIKLLSEEDSLVVVTADHAHVMTFNGYSPRGKDILGPSRDRDSDGIPYMTLSYTNGPGFRPHVNGRRQDVTVEPDIHDTQWRSHVDAPLESETHGGDDVAVFAWGCHHSLFTGLYEQSNIPHRMAYAGCFGPGQHACNGATPGVAHLPLALTTLTLIFAMRITS